MMAGEYVIVIVIDGTWRLRARIIFGVPRGAFRWRAIPRSARLRSGMEKLHHHLIPFPRLLKIGRMAGVRDHDDPSVW